MQENQNTDPLLFDVWNKKKRHKQEPTIILVQSKAYWHDIMHIITKNQENQNTNPLLFDAWNKKNYHKWEMTIILAQSKAFNCKV